MLNEDVFVGCVAVIAGAVIFAAGALNWNGWYATRKARWFVARLGRTRARIVYCVVGGFLIALGVAVAMGFRWNVFA